MANGAWPTHLTIQKVILDDVEEDTGDLATLCSEAIRVLTLFESIIEPELQRQATRPLGRPIAKKLTVQHRMHPSIAKLISKSFYNDELYTAETRKAYFKDNKPPFTSTDTRRVPEKPIIFLNIPYVQNELVAVEGVHLPRCCNDREIN